MEDMVKKCFQNGLDQTWLCDYGGWREEFEENDICETGDNPSEGKQRRKEGGSWRGQEQVLPQHEYKYTNTQILIQKHKYKNKYKNRDIKKPVGLRQLHASTKKSIPSFFGGHARHYYPRLSESREPKKERQSCWDRTGPRTKPRTKAVRVRKGQKDKLGGAW